jgi:hypothetical protein
MCGPNCCFREKPTPRTLGQDLITSGVGNQVYVIETQPPQFYSPNIIYAQAQTVIVRCVFLGDKRTEEHEINSRLNDRRASPEELYQLSIAQSQPLCKEEPTIPSQLEANAHLRAVGLKGLITRQGP